MNAQISQTDDYHAQIAAGVDAREDGEFEQSADILKNLLAQFPGDAAGTLEYVKALKKLGKLEEADAAIDQAIKDNPKNFDLRRAWAELPIQTIDHHEIRRRGRAVRAEFPPETYSGAWHSLAAELDGFYEMGEWQALAAAIDTYWDYFISYREALPLALLALNKLFAIDKIESLIKTAKPEAWRNLPPGAAANLRLRTAVVKNNQEILRQSGVRVISLGQNCLPYQLCGRWGLVAPMAKPEDMTPFDLGAFSSNRTADAVSTDFSGFADRAQYHVAVAWGGGLMPLHKPTGIGFFHERGPYWLDDGMARFFGRIDGMIANWRQIKTQGRRLFVFCLCGAGDLEVLVSAAEKYLLDENAHLLIVNVLKQPHDCPQHNRVTYIHAPYPDGYDWGSLSQQSSAATMRYELGIMNAIIGIISKDMPPVETEKLAAGRRRALSGAAKEVLARNTHEVGTELYNLLLAKSPEEAVGMLDYAEALRLSNRREEAGDVLKRAIETWPNDVSLLKAWAELPIHVADWQETLDRTKLFRKKVQPVSETLSWSVLNLELSALAATGAWDEAGRLITKFKDAFTTEPALFVTALGIAGNLYWFAGLRMLLDEAAPAARRAVPEAVMENLRRQLDTATANRQLLTKKNTQVIALGSNTLAAFFAGRWGLTARKASYKKITLFDAAWFHGNSAAEAIATDFANLSDPAGWSLAPAWGGGKMPVHAALKVELFGHRQANWPDKDWQGFTTHLHQMIKSWRQIRGKGKRIFLYFHTTPSDLSRLADVVSEHLLGPDAHLFIVDAQPAAASIPVHPKITYLHAPFPENYIWHSVVVAGSDVGAAYERRILAPMIDFLEKY